MALLRVKRRPHEDPIDVLLLACKKQKTEDPSFSTVFKFAATVEEKDKDLETHVNKVKETVNEEGRESLYKKRQVADITDKLRAENKLFSHNNRLKVISCFRHGENGSDEKEVTVVDIENHPQEITNEAPKDSHSSEDHQPSTKEQYVYDLYYSNEKGDFDDLMMENMLSAHAVDEMLFDFSGQEGDENEIIMDDEDDSNDENNWRNDYPDEVSDDESIDDGEIRLAMQMKNVNLDGEYESDLSTDREDEVLIYGDDFRNHYYYCSSDRENSDSDSEY